MNSITNGWPSHWCRLLVIQLSINWYHPNGLWYKHLIHTYKFVNLFPRKICQNYFREETDADQRNRCLLHSDPYTTHTVGRNGCQGFFFCIPCRDQSLHTNAEFVNAAGESVVCACEMQRVITVQLLCWLHAVVVEVCWILNKIIYTRAVFFQPPMGYKKKTNWHNIVILLPKVQQGLTYFST